MNSQKGLLLDEEHHLVAALADLLAACVAPSGDRRGPDLDGFDTALAALASCMDGLHVLKEERVLFPLLQSRGLTRDHAVVNALLTQHETARVYLGRLRTLSSGVRAGQRDALRQLTADLREFVALVHEHIRIEDDYFYRVAREHLQPADVERIGVEFQRLEQAVDGTAIRARCERVLRDAGRVG